MLQDKRTLDQAWSRCARCGPWQHVIQCAGHPMCPHGSGGTIPLLPNIQTHEEPQIGCRIPHVGPGWGSTRPQCPILEYGWEEVISDPLDPISACVQWEEVVPCPRTQYQSTEKRGISTGSQGPFWPTVKLCAMQFGLWGQRVEHHCSRWIFLPRD